MNERKEEKLKLWHPNATVRWSLLFTPIFGAWLQAKNWTVLREEAKAKKAMQWVYIGFVMWNDPKKLDKK